MRFFVWFKLAYLVVRLEKNLIVLRERYKEDYGRYILEAVNPFTPLRPLPPNINHPKRKQTMKTSKNWFLTSCQRFTHNG